MGFCEESHYNLRREYYPEYYSFNGDNNKKRGHSIYCRTRED